MEEFSPNSLAGRIQKRLQRLGIKPARASLEATGKPDLVRKIFNAARDGSEYRPQYDNLDKLAKVLQTPVQWLVDSTGPEELTELDDDGHFPAEAGEGEGLMQGGIVEAGSFRKVDPFYNQDHPRRVPIQPDVRYPKVRQLAYEIRGDSMNKAGMVDGMWAIAGVYEDYQAHYGDVPSGRFVIVERQRFGGSESEVTIKEIRFFKDRFELVPHSTNPTHQIQTVYYDQEADPDELVTIIRAVVFGAYNVF